MGVDAFEVQEFCLKFESFRGSSMNILRISIKIFDNIHQCPSPPQQQKEEKLISRCSGSDSTENCDNQWKSSWTTVFLSFPQFIWLLWCSQISTLAALAEMRIFFTSFHSKASNLLMSIARYIIKIDRCWGEWERQISSHSCVSCRLQLYFSAWWEAFRCFLCALPHLSDFIMRWSKKVRKRTVKVVRSFFSSVSPRNRKFSSCSDKSVRFDWRKKDINYQLRSAFSHFSLPFAGSELAGGGETRRKAASTWSLTQIELKRLEN